MSRRPLTSEDWVRDVGRQLAILDTAEFAPNLVESLHKWCRNDRGMLYVLRRSRRPWLLFDERVDGRCSARPGNPELEARAYLGGGYLLDPYYRAFLEGGRQGLYTPADLDADSIEQSAPRGWSGSEHVAFLSPVSPDTCLVLLLLRDDGEPFSSKDVAALRLVEICVCPALRLHWKSYARSVVGKGEDSGQVYEQVQLALSEFGAGTLTPRESEVIRLMLRGQSTKRAASRLGIAATTAALHRKRAYAKLEVCSQAELFHLFIRSLSAARSSEHPLS
jgi:DNA-binding CsgD family transcriptional regulator